MTFNSNKLFVIETDQQKDLISLILIELNLRAQKIYVDGIVEEICRPNQDTVN